MPLRPYLLLIAAVLVAAGATLALGLIVAPALPAGAAPVALILAMLAALAARYFTR